MRISNICFEILKERRFIESWKTQLSKIGLIVNYILKVLQEYDLTALEESSPTSVKNQVLPTSMTPTTSVIAVLSVFGHSVASFPEDEESRSRGLVLIIFCCCVSSDPGICSTVVC